MMLSAKDLLQTLVRIPSVNPAFQTTKSASGGEAATTNFLQNFFQNLSWPWLRQQVHPGRDNLIAVCRASGEAAGQPPVLWEVHQDTVGIEGMSIDPFAADEAQGRIWGRGACDVKGSMAAMLAALAQLHDEQKRLSRPILIAFSINEECGFTGVKSLCQIWDDSYAEAKLAQQTTGPLSLAELRQLRPAQAIVAEPTLLDVVVAHKGSVRWQCHTRGRAAHTSRPERGINAISTMVRVVQAIEQYQADVLSQRPTHPLCGPPTVCVSTIRGGTGVNTVPDHVVIDIDRRLVPEESPEQAYAELVEYVASHTVGCAAAVEHDLPSNQSAGLLDHNNRPWAEQIAATVRSLGPSSQLIGVPYGTDAWALSTLGIPTVVFGPGSIEQAHTKDEWIDVQQLELATEAFYQLAIATDA